MHTDMHRICMHISSPGPVQSSGSSSTWNHCPGALPQSLSWWCTGEAQISGTKEAQGCKRQTKQLVTKAEVYSAWINSVQHLEAGECRWQLSQHPGSIWGLGIQQAGCLTPCLWTGLDETQRHTGLAAQCAFSPLPWSAQKTRRG